MHGSTLNSVGTFIALHSSSLPGAHAVPETKGKSPNELLAFFNKGYKPAGEEEEDDSELFA